MTLWIRRSSGTYGPFPVNCEIDPAPSVCANGLGGEVTVNTTLRTTESMFQRIIRVIHDTGGNNPKRWAANVDITDRPCPAITNGIGGMNSCHFKVETVNVPSTSLSSDQPATERHEPGRRAVPDGSDGRDIGIRGTVLDRVRRSRERERESMDKPPYRVPTMPEIVAIPWNGLKVASTFSGAGGSCTGYRMAGFKVVWANEFVPAAQASYKANAAPDCHLDCRDIKHVQSADIFSVTGLKEGELDLFDGSPPCQAFSTAGKREKGWGKDKTYEHGAKQQNETLFSEYIRLLRGLMPKTFVAENVSGLVKGTAKGYFLEILRDLKASGYRVTCKVLDAQWLGVPQTRQRTIFVGVREDLKLDPVHPKPLAYRYSVRDALPHITAFQQMAGYNGHPFLSSDQPSQTIIRTGSHNCEAKIEGANGFNGHAGKTVEQPMSTVQAGRPVNVTSGTVRRKFTIDEVKAICSFPPDFILKGSYAQQWERLGNSVPPLMMRAIAEQIRDRILLPIRDTATQPGKSTPPRQRRASKP